MTVYTLDTPDTGEDLDLDVQVIDEAVSVDLPPNSDDGCGASCPHSCTTSYG